MDDVFDFLQFQLLAVFVVVLLFFVCCCCSSRREAKRRSVFPPTNRISYGPGYGSTSADLERQQTGGHRKDLSWHAREAAEARTRAERQQKRPTPIWSPPPPPLPKFQARVHPPTPSTSTWSPPPPAFPKPRPQPPLPPLIIPRHPQTPPPPPPRPRQQPRPALQTIANLRIVEETSSSSSSVGDEPGSRWRKLAQTEYDTMKALIAKRKKMDRRAPKSSVTTEIDRHKALMEKYNSTAATEIFRHRNEKFGDTLSDCDLHWLTVTEATEYLNRHLKKCRERGVLTTRIITGRGKHTSDGVAKIRPKIKELLDANKNVKVVSENVGDFGIRLV